MSVTMCTKIAISSSRRKRMRILDNGSSLISIDASSTMSDNATSYESLAVGRDPADDEESEDLFSDDDNDELL